MACPPCRRAVCYPPARAVGALGWERVWRDRCEATRSLCSGPLSATPGGRVCCGCWKLVLHWPVVSWEGQNEARRTASAAEVARLTAPEAEV